MSTSPAASPIAYNDYFYSLMDTAANQSAEVIVPWLMEWIAPESVVDIGCGHGEWLMSFARRGVSNLLGLDGPWVERSKLAIPAERFRTTSLDRPWSLDERFDLALCLEVAEHLPAAQADGLVANLTAASPVVLFSAAIPGQGGTEHINEQWPSYWVGRFARHGFERIDALRPRIWHDTRVGWYYQQNLFLFASESGLAAHQRLRDELERHGSSPLTLVHERSLRPMTTLKAALAQLPSLVAEALRRRFRSASRTRP